MTDIYGNDDRSPYEDAPPTQNSLAAMWTPEAQQRYERLKSLPSDILDATNTRAALGYLEGYKKAAERKGTN